MDGEAEFVVWKLDERRDEVALNVNLHDDNFAASSSDDGVAVDVLAHSPRTTTMTTT